MKKRISKYFWVAIGISIVLLVTFFYVALKIIEEEEQEIMFEELGELCDLNGGNWVSGFNECEYLSKEVCELTGGVFNECASACRNEENPEFCVMMCVPVCDYNNYAIG